jgi:SAM-dependent methyltransferase
VPDFYDDPSIYDILHAPGTAHDVAGLERMSLRFAPGRPHRHRWLEPACGTARLLRLAAAHGRRVVGFDMNERMIEYARARIVARGLARRAALFVADMETYHRRREPIAAHFAFNLINTIRRLDADAPLPRHLAARVRALVLGGVYAVGLSLSDYARERTSEDVWEGARGRCRVTQIVQYIPPGPRARREKVVSPLVIDRPRGVEHVDSTYVLRAYDATQWHGAIDASPFTLEAIVDESGRDMHRRAHGYAIYVLRAPGRLSR